MAIIRAPERTRAPRKRSRKTPDTSTHQALVKKAEAWLRRVGCGVVLTELRTRNGTGEEADAIGWRDGLSVMVECKASRSDFLADKHKSFRKEPEKGVGDWRFFMCPDGLIKPQELPPGWGLLYVSGRRTTHVHGVPSNMHWWPKRPFRGNRDVENSMLVSALRRVPRTKEAA